MSQQNTPTRVTTGVARLSYCNLLRPYARDASQEPKYSTTVLIPKTDTATMQRVNAAIEAAAQAGASKLWGGRPPKLDTPIHDGDGPRPSDGMPYGEECKGHYVFTASSKMAPEVVDAQMNPIINQSDVYGGMYARVSVNFFPYAQAGKKGVGCGLGNVQKIQDGEPLGGGRSAEQDFGEYTGAPAAAPGQAYQQPAAYAPGQSYQPQQPAYAPQAQPQYQQPPQQAYQQPAYAPQAQSQYQPPAQQNINPITGQPM